VTSVAVPVQSIVGRRIRELRKEKGLTLRALSDLTGRSIGFLSQVERGQSSISLTTLRELAASLGRPMAEFFGQLDGELIDRPPDQPTPTVEAAARPVWTLTRASADGSDVVFSGNRTFKLLSARTAGLTLEPLLVHIAPGGAMEEVDPGHEGEEFAFVLKGELLYVIDGRELRLGPGDSMHLRSNVPHQIHNDGAEVTVVVSVLTPRLF
jgi:transcriptional regulator with XRE-family HTH domain